MKSISSSRRVVYGFLCAFLAVLVCSPFLVSYAQPHKSTNPIKVSVLVPVYNTEKYLDESLQTIENQTLKEIEIICVNDGSKDGSLQILESHQQKDPRIKIINQQNSGVCVARNNALKAAKGDYIIYCDSDDVIPPYAYQKAYESAIKYNVNVVSLGLTTFREGEETVDLNSFKYDESKVKRRGRRSYQNPFYYMAKNTGYVVNKLYKRSFLRHHNLFFIPGMTNYEDGLFNLLALPMINEMVEDDNIFYCYRLNRPNSAVTSFNVPKILKSTLIATKVLLEHHDLYTFRKGDEWLMDKIMDFNYNHLVKDCKDPDEQKYYASKLLELLDGNYLKKYDMKISKGNLERLQTLREIAARS